MTDLPTLKDVWDQHREILANCFVDDDVERVLRERLLSHWKRLNSGLSETEKRYCWGRISEIMELLGHKTYSHDLIKNELKELLGVEE